MHTQISCAQARSIDLVEYLRSLGYQPQKVRHPDYWYLSPLRPERHASFKVDRKLNLWYDHGSGQGGNLIDFGLLYYKCSIPELLDRLSSLALAPSFHPPLSPNPLPAQKEEKIKITAISDITSRSLLTYLEQRKIDASLAAWFCREVHFTLYNKEHIALGFPNKLGGYELRNKYFKGSSAPKAPTFIDRNSPTVSVFEGFFDFLSFLTLYPERKEGTTSFLVLNSLSLLEQAKPTLGQHRLVHLYLDRDAAGRRATRSLLDTSVHYKDRSPLYRHNKDLNEFLVSQKDSRKQTLKAARKRSM